MNGNTGVREPNLHDAMKWFPRMAGQFGPLGWKDHQFEFLQLWSGDLVAAVTGQAQQQREAERKGLQSYLSDEAFFVFQWATGTGDNWKTSENIGSHLYDDKSRIQWLQDGDKPVAFTQWLFKGVAITERVFCHVPGGAELERGDEPLFAWVHFEIPEILRTLNFDSEIKLHVHISGRYLTTNMAPPRNSVVQLPLPDYAHPLRLEENHIMQADGRVRLTVLPSPGQEVSFTVGAYDQTRGALGKNVLTVKTSLQEGQAINLLIPFIPVSPDDTEVELAIGQTRALEETLRFWAKQSESAAQVHVAEPFVEQTFHSMPWRLFTIAERNVASGQYCLNSGAYNYEGVWATPFAMITVWGLDYLGLHKDADRYLETFRINQGSMSPPGEGFVDHPGYLTTPAMFESIPWVSDHGAILWATGEHAMLSGDEDFYQRWLLVWERGLEWIAEQRRSTKHGGYPGIMPPGRATDSNYRSQLVWNDSWCYAGMRSVIETMKLYEHPQALHWSREADEYRLAFQEAYKKAVKELPTWRDKSGVERPFAPTDLLHPKSKMNAHAFYLDTGPLHLGWSGLLDVCDPIIESTLLWFSEGPQVKYWQPESTCWQVPIFDHEMSSCEPCYSWNIPLRFARNERLKYIEGLYSMVAGSLGRELLSDVETRNGRFSTGFATPCTFYVFRHGLVHENNDTLELLKMVPKAWTKPGEVLSLTGAATRFGPMSISVRVTQAGSCVRYTVQVDFPKRRQPKRVILYLPPTDDELEVFVNDNIMAIGADGTVDLTSLSREVAKRDCNLL